MKKEYKINLRYQIKSFRECFVTLALTIGWLPLGPFFINDFDFITMFTTCILLWAVTSVGISMPFHINYLIVNWGTRLIVDNEMKTITLIQSGQTFEFKFSEIKIIRHINGHYRPDRNKSYMPIPFDCYGYLEIMTNDNKELYLTSLMLDPFNPPVSINKTEYGFPIIFQKK